MEIKVFQEPFPHVHFTSVLPISTRTKIVSELEAITSWLRVKQNLYELDVLEQISSSQISLKEADMLNFLKKVHGCAYNELNILLEKKIRLHIHRFVQGTGVSLHTDSADEGLRLLIFFQPSLQSFEGGYLLLANKVSGETKLIFPADNTAVLFATQSNWLHAVTEQIEGIRYSMVFQLFRNNNLEEKF